MRLAIIGGGGFRVPLVVRALVNDPDAGIEQVHLVDTEATRLQQVTRVCAELEGASDGPSVHAHAVPDLTVPSLREALSGIDVVFVAIRVGGLAGRALDERIPLRHGVIGQETVGAGGLSYALRTLPVMTQLATSIATLAPQAWTINFTNPAGIITQAITEPLAERVVGICDSPVGLVRRAANAVGAGPDDAVRFDYLGLNHLGWLQRLEVNGIDRLPGLVADAERLASFEEGRLFGPELIGRLGLLPNEYLHHFYFADQDLAAFTSAAQHQTRAEQIMAQQQDFYGAGSASGLQDWERARLAREQTYMEANRSTSGGFERDAEDLSGGGYDQMALALMRALTSTDASDHGTVMVVNRPNRTRVLELDQTDVIEAPCLVAPGRIDPLPVVALPSEPMQLVRTIKHTEHLVIQAARQQSRALAIDAFASHPLVGPSVAPALVDDLVEAHEGLAYLH